MALSVKQAVQDYFQLKRSKQTQMTFEEAKYLLSKGHLAGVSDAGYIVTPTGLKLLQEYRTNK